MKTLKEILPYYLNVELSVRIDFYNNINSVFRIPLTISTFEQCVKYGKPMLRTFNSLTKPITVEGETFIPIEKLKINPDWFYLDKWIGNIENMNFGELQLLLKWHFNVFNLPTDQFIEIKD